MRHRYMLLLSCQDIIYIYRRSLDTFYVHVFCECRVLLNHNNEQTKLVRGLDEEEYQMEVMIVDLIYDCLESFNFSYYFYIIL